MPPDYSMDLRLRVLAAYDRGMRTKQIAAMFGVSPAWARRLKQTRRETGEIAPKKRVRKKLVYKIDRAILAELVEQQPDATLAELRDQLAERGIDCSISGVDRALRKIGVSFKKRRSTPRNRTVRTLPSDVTRGGSRSPISTPNA